MAAITFIIGAVSDLAAGETIDGTNETTTKDVLQLNSAGTYDFSTVDVTDIDQIHLNQDAAGYNLVLTTSMVSTAWDASGPQSFGTLGIYSDVTLTNGVTIDASAVTGSNRITILGNNFGGNDTFIGSAYHDIVSLGAGNDTFTGGKGLDSLNGGAGDDIFYMASGDLDNTVSGFEFDHRRRRYRHHSTDQRRHLRFRHRRVGQRRRNLQWQQRR